MRSHRIHLKGLWEYVISPPAGSTIAGGSEAGTVRMPQAWREIFGDVCGTAQFRRKFHRPTNLESHEHVVLVFTEIRGSGQVLLNGQHVGQFNAAGDAVEIEITSLLKPFNEIAVEISFDPQFEPGAPGGLSGAVALEIRTEDA